MAGLTGPLFSLSARGTIGQTLTYATWRGIDYVRQRVVPANPNTTGQQDVRNTFSMLMETWKRAPTLFQAPWTANATGQPFTNRNALVRENVPALQGDADMSDFVWSPGALGGPAPASITVTPGVGQLTVDITAPALPTGWTIQAGVAAALDDDDPQTTSFFTITAGEDTTSPYSVVLTGLTAGQLHRVGAWLRWTRPDSQTAYSTALTDSGTPT